MYILPGVPWVTLVALPLERNIGLLLQTHLAASLALGEKGHIQAEMQSPGSLSSQKKKYSIIYSHKRFQACKEKSKTGVRRVAVSWKSA